MNILRVIAVEQYEKTSILVAQASVELNRQAMRFLSNKMIVMNGDPLAGRQPVRHQHDPVFQGDAEKRTHRRANRRKIFRRRQPGNAFWKNDIEHAELVLLVEIGFHEPPWRIRLEPFKKRKVKIRREATPRQEVAEGRGVEFNLRVFAQWRKG